MNFTAYDLPDWIKVELLNIHREYEVRRLKTNPIKIEAYAIDDVTIEYIVKYNSWADETYRIELGLNYKLYPEQFKLLYDNGFQII
jgi:hypothetical protein